MVTRARTPRFLSIVMAVVVVSAGPVTAGPPGAEAAQVELVALPREFVAMAEWATDRFERAALELPRYGSSTTMVIALPAATGMVSIIPWTAST